jgi:hypothetical protein
VTWAQRSSKDTVEKNIIFLTIVAPDVSPSAAKIDLKPTSLSFAGHSQTKNIDYHVELDFFEEIDVEHSKTNHTASKIEFVLRKKEMKEEFWPRLTKEKQKLHFLKTDFDKWVDEDEQDEKEEDLGGMGDMGGMGGMGGGMPGMPGMGGDGGFGGIDFSKLGGMGGLGDMGGMGGMPDMGGMGGEDEDDVSRARPYEDSELSSNTLQDDDMPALEGEAEEPAATEAKGKGKEGEAAAPPKIEEIN